MMDRDLAIARAVRDYVFEYMIRRVPDSIERGWCNDEAMRRIVDAVDGSEPPPRERERGRPLGGVPVYATDAFLLGLASNIGDLDRLGLEEDFRQSLITWIESITEVIVDARKHWHSPLQDGEEKDEDRSP
jgi:hypothetical protein